MSRETCTIIEFGTERGVHGCMTVMIDRVARVRVCVMCVRVCVRGVYIHMFAFVRRVCAIRVDGCKTAGTPHALCRPRSMLAERGLAV